MADTTHISETVSAGQLRAYIERVERLEEEIKTLNGDKSEIYKEARGCGFDVKAIRQCVAARKLDSAEREERTAIFEMYWSALTGSVHVHTRTREIIEQFDAETGEITDQELPVEPATTTPASQLKEVTGGNLSIPSTDAGGEDRAASAGHHNAQSEQAAQSNSHSSDGIPVETNKAGAFQASQAAPATISDDDVPAFLRKEHKPLRPHCLRPDNCAGYGTHTCHTCTVAAREVEPA